MKKVNVLIFPAGGENSLEVFDSLKFGVGINVYGASSRMDYSCLEYKSNLLFLPNISDVGFERKFIEILLAKEIDIIFPTHDTVVKELSKIRDKLPSEVVNSDPYAAEICRNKRKTYALFNNESWVPEVYLSPSQIEYPAIVKPEVGEGGKGVKMLKNKDELLDIDTRDIICEYLPGEEVTVDCYTNKSSELLHFSPRLRNRVLGGISMDSELIAPSPEIKKIAEAINAKLNLCGPWFFQLKRDRKNQWKLLEISMRSSGSMVSQRVHQVNLPMLVVKEYAGADVNILHQNYGDKIFRRLTTKTCFNKPLNDLYVDLDDTLIVRGRVNPEVLGAIYLFISFDRKVYLLTRHENNVNGTLSRYRINKNLFQQIHHITSQEKKSDYITLNSLLIDNSFFERQDVIRFGKGYAIDVHDVSLFEFEASLGGR